MENAVWTADVVGLLHLHRISQKELATKLGVTPTYVNMILNGKKTPAGAESRFRTAIWQIVQNDRKEGAVDTETNGAAGADDPA